MSHTPLLQSGSVIKRKLNAIRPVPGGGPIPPVYGLLTFFGSNQPVPPLTVEGFATTKRAEWNEYLSQTYDILTFESYALGFQAMSWPVPATFTLNGIDLTIPNKDDGFGGPWYDPSTRFIVSNDTASGRFNTTPSGSKFLNSMVTMTAAEPDLISSLEFDPPISFFGAYFTDIGDFTGVLSLILVAVDDSTTTHVLSTGSEGNGRLTFWGFVDSLQTYKRITFVCSVGEIEGWGMDDAVYGPVSFLVTP